MSDRFDHTLEHTLETKPANGADDSIMTVRRIELITGDGRRRRWSDDEKARIVVESMRPGANISEVARRNGLSPQQLFGWRREARALIAGQADASAAPPPERAEARRDRRKSRALAGERSPAERMPAFASVVVATSAAAPTAGAPPASPPASPASGRIEIAFGDAIVRVIGQVEPATLAAVLRVVRRTT